MDQMVTLALPDQAAAFRAVRARTEWLCRSLSPEDQTIQSMEDASPAKWHRAHTTWFYEQFILRDRVPGYRSYDEDFNFLFNSYYVSLGARHARPARGMITRPTADEVGAYRAAVDRAMLSLLASGSDPERDALLRLGLAHEEQHQELLLTDVMHALARNPLSWAGGRARSIAVLPGWTEPRGAPDDRPAPVEHPGGIAQIGHDGDDFAFDNEGPRHDVLLRPHAIATRLVRNADWLGFMRDGGYRQPTLWMSDGWSRREAEGWEMPLYWHADGDAFVQWGPGGLAPLDPDAPVRHVSWYEADAFARWSEARLPTEFELEASAGSLAEFDTHVWQWTNSAYLAYPGFRPDTGAIGEYNGKFMINQMVLRGGSFATSPSHARPGYRNFFPPEKRWQVTGVRLAFDR